MMRQNKWFLILFLFFANLNAQYFFGKNKIQITKYAWQIIQTEHFEIYYFKEESLLALYSAQIAEQSYEKLVSFFGVVPPNRIPIIIYSSANLFQETQTIPILIPENVGGFTDYLKGRVVLPFSGSLADFRHTLTHELVHIFTFQFFEKGYNDRDIFFFTLPPLWVMEGIAEHLSERSSPEMNLILRSSTLDGSIVLPHRLDEIGGSYKMYKEGEGFLLYLAQKYSDERLMKLFSRFLSLRDFESAFMSTFGKSVEAEGKNWVYSLKKVYFPLLSSRDEPPQVGEELVGKPWISSPVVLAADSGNYEVIFKGSWMGYTGIYRLTKGKPELILKGEFSDPFESLHGVTNRIDITPSGKLAFVAKAQARDVLYLYDLASGETIFKKVIPGLISISSPSLSQSGDTVVFSGTDIRGGIDLYLYIISKDSLVRLTDDIYEDKDPAISPRGKSIAFVSDRGGDKSALFLFMLETNEIFEILRLDGNIGEPRWWGEDLIFTVEDDSSRDIFILRHNELYRLTRVTTGLFSPVFTPRGDSVIACAWWKDSYRLFRFPALHSEYVCATEPVPFESVLPALPPGESKEGKKFAYKKKLTLDIAQGTLSTQSATESGGGLELFLTDMVGEHQIYLLLYSYSQEWKRILRETNIYLSYTNQAKRFQWTLGAYHLFNRDYSGIYDTYEEESIGIVGSVAYPFSRFRRLQASLFLRYNARLDTYPEDNYYYAPLATLNVSFIRDNSLSDAIGPIDGMRSNLTVGVSSDLKRQKLYSSIISFDYRRYFRLSERVSWANRIVARSSQGIKPEIFFMGGTWTFRGYPAYHFMGSKLFLLNTELRFPLVEDFWLKTPFLSLRFGGIKGALFFDTGQAFDKKWVNPCGSFGLSARLNLAYYTVLRLDTAWRTDFHTIDPHTYWEIFFGRDF